MEFLKKYLDYAGMSVLVAYVLVLLFAAMDDHFGWNILIHYF